ncbi:MAG: hypothetical protein ACREK5_09275 [Gemmatimonadota bacterium]
MIIPLSGPPPLVLLEEPKERDESDTGRIHTDPDRRSLALGRAIADRLSQDPSLIERAREYIERRLKRASSGEKKELHEWKRLLESLSPVQIRRLLVDPGERATRLRQTLPFLEALSVEERDRILEEVSE